MPSLFTLTAPKMCKYTMLFISTNHFVIVITGLGNILCASLRKTMIFRLYLDTVMRSQNDADNASKNLPPGFYCYADLDMAGMKQRETRIHKIISFFRKCCRRRRTFRDSRAVIAPTDSFLSRQMKMFSFSEVELKKLNPNLTETGVQTGDSLDIQFDSKSRYGRLKRLRDSSLLPYHGSTNVMTAKCKMEPICSKMRSKVERFTDSYETNPEDSINVIEEGSQYTSEVSELSVMKFFKAVRSGSVQWSEVDPYDLRRVSIPIAAETELRNTIFDQTHSMHEPKVEKRKKRIHSSASSFTQTEPVAGPSGNILKRLRFVEQLSDQEHDDEDHEHGKELSKRFWGVGKTKAKKKTNLPFMPR